MDIKRTFDQVGSAAGLIVLSPVFAIVSAVGAINFKTNPFYSTERIGKDGKPFNMIKFRSMSDNKDAEGHLLPDDMRLTQWGKFIRATSIDELPQMLNVIKGDMSLVGPRPRSRSEKIPPGCESILAARPGITGPWQVAVIGAIDSSSEEKRNKLDAAYVQERSGMLGDLAILVKTVPALVLGHDGESLSGKKGGQEPANSLNIE
jgi:lipopolysaccharide/colanic/teichoic acid biosynthesis glycosyltransferase